MSEGTAAADAILELIAASMDKASFANWLAANCRARVSMELRDFMQAITLELLIDTAETFHVDRGATPDSLGATVNEAATAIPLVRDLFRACCEMWDTAGEQERVSAIDNLKTLTALYRIAEDMGYEW
jgi:hypothetical protein